MAEDEKKSVNKKAPVQRATTGKTATKKATVATKAIASAATKTVARKTPAAPAARSAPAAAPRPTPVAQQAGVSPKPAAAAPEPGAAAQSRSRLEEKPIDLRSPVSVGLEERDAMIRDAAYFKAERHNFDPRFDMENWAEAEHEVDERLSRRGA